MADEIKIKLNENTNLAVYISPEPYKEVTVYVEKDGVAWQDLAIVREKYHYEGENIVSEEGAYEILAYTDEFSEDYTHRFEVSEYKEE